VSGPDRLPLLSLREVLVSYADQGEDEDLDGLDVTTWLRLLEPVIADAGQADNASDPQDRRFGRLWHEAREQILNACADQVTAYADHTDLVFEEPCE